MQEIPKIPETPTTQYTNTKGYFSLDPSTRRLGWSFYLAGGQDEDFDALMSPSWKFGSFCPDGDGLQTKLKQVQNFFRACYNLYQPINYFVAELPSFMSSAKGQIAAQEGFTINLGIVIGIAIGCLHPSAVYLYTPQQWKGSVTKEITHKKLLRKFIDGKDFKLNHDCIDAIMILRHHIETTQKLTSS